MGICCIFFSESIFLKKGRLLWMTLLYVGGWDLIHRGLCLSVYHFASTCGEVGDGDPLLITFCFFREGCFMGIIVLLGFSSTFFCLLGLDYRGWFLLLVCLLCIVTYMRWMTVDRRIK
ncbi:uncharacterized protein BDW43DRAFT_84341 [Aspergillus alliaceus]|uniref:uncharacterized protein n=1 Tax=Petromyces alliaceus TaxID=209559 RepID=UPI0012A6D8B3|nr:uncharacterized protein BDW43DRAFT_84341 [Aspergillus alliaceus]KAB8233677.1 hypothetical protein BDW43DRAFT_84341 [Aspergillus alliaceus]